MQIFRARSLVVFVTIVVGFVSFFIVLTIATSIRLEANFCIVSARKICIKLLNKNKRNCVIQKKKNKYKETKNSYIFNIYYICIKNMFINFTIEFKSRKSFYIDPISSGEKPPEQARGAWVS